MKKVSLVFALMLGASVFLTACSNEEYVDEEHLRNVVTNVKR